MIMSDVVPAQYRKDLSCIPEKILDNSTSLLIYINSPYPELAEGLAL